MAQNTIEFYQSDEDSYDESDQHIQPPANVQKTRRNREWKLEPTATFTPCTNKALEAFNRVIKAEGTYRERLPLSRFFPLCLGLDLLQLGRASIV